MILRYFKYFLSVCLQAIASANFLINLFLENQHVKVSISQSVAVLQAMDGRWFMWTKLPKDGEPKEPHTEFAPNLALLRRKMIGTASSAMCQPTETLANVQSHVTLQRSAVPGAWDLQNAHFQRRKWALLPSKWLPSSCKGLQNAELFVECPQIVNQGICKTSGCKLTRWRFVAFVGIIWWCFHCVASTQHVTWTTWILGTPAVHRGVASESAVARPGRKHLQICYEHLMGYWFQWIRMDVYGWMVHFKRQVPHAGRSLLLGSCWFQPRRFKTSAKGLRCELQTA